LLIFGWWKLLIGSIIFMTKLVKVLTRESVPSDTDQYGKGLS